MQDARFHNPYTFIWTPPRNGVPKGSFAGDADPAGEADHGRLHSNLYTGTIRLKLTMVTPLLLVDTDPRRVETLENGHKIFDSREDIPVTAFKGMLRSAYEVITNSRYAVFQGHMQRLPFRHPPSVALDLRPGRIELHHGRKNVRLLQAARLPRYVKGARDKRHGEVSAALKYGDTGGLPAHGEECWVKVTRDGFLRNVTQIWAQRPSARHDVVRGWVFCSGPTIGEKTHERVFYEAHRGASSGQLVAVSPPVEETYRLLVKSYRDQHDKDQRERKAKGDSMTDYLGSEPGDTAFAPYVFDQRREELLDGDLVFAKMENQDLSALFPCMISRDIHPDAPAALLDDSLKPAIAIDQLSPSDRLLGWVRQDENRDPRGDRVAAWKGRLRITPNSEASSIRLVDLTESDPNGVPLAILGEPKPAQARFYVGKSDGAPLKAGIRKADALYSRKESRRLRGRKAYWHHRGLPEGYWDDPNQDRTQWDRGRVGYHQEYRRPESDKVRDGQNRSVRSWIGQGSTAGFTLHLTNARLEEVGALLFLATLPPGHFLRMGGGKPLGFGSVRLELDGEPEAVRLASGNAWAAFYRSFGAVEPDWEDGERLREDARDRFLRAMVGGSTPEDEAKPEDRFETLPFIRDFLAACRGPSGDLPVHYPRKDKAPHPEGKNFDWFTANEKEKRGKRPGLPLPAAASDDSLPLIPRIPTDDDGSTGGGVGGRGGPDSPSRPGGLGGHGTGDRFGGTRTGPPSRRPER